MVFLFVTVFLDLLQIPSCTQQMEGSSRGNHDVTGAEIGQLAWNTSHTKLVKTGENMLLDNTDSETEMIAKICQRILLTFHPIFQELTGQTEGEKDNLLHSSLSWGSIFSVQSFQEKSVESKRAFCDPSRHNACLWSTMGSLRDSCEVSKKG